MLPRSAGRRGAAPALAALLLCTALTGCAGDAIPAPSGGPGPARPGAAGQARAVDGAGSFAPCRSVSRVGERLASDFAGCLDDDGEIAAHSGIGCLDGSTLFTRGAAWAVTGESVHVAPDVTDRRRDPDYRAAVRTCRR